MLWRFKIGRHKYFTCSGCGKKVPHMLFYGGVGKCCFDKDAYREKPIAVAVDAKKSERAAKSYQRKKTRMKRLKLAGSGSGVL